MSWRKAGWYETFPHLPCVSDFVLESIIKKISWWGYSRKNKKLFANFKCLQNRNENGGRSEKFFGKLSCFLAHVHNFSIIVLCCRLNRSCDYFYTKFATTPTTTTNTKIIVWKWPSNFINSRFWDLFPSVMWRKVSRIQFSHRISNFF